MRKNNDRMSAGAIIAIIASAILVAAGVIVAFKLLCDKYSITENPFLLHTELLQDCSPRIRISKENQYGCCPVKQAASLAVLRRV